MMINHLIQGSSNLLPLSVNSVSWDGDTLMLIGSDWSFSTMSAWRIINAGEIQIACWDNNAEDYLKKLEGLLIVAIQPQSQYIQVDPVFELSNGKQLEIFSTDTVEPWSLQLPNGKLYIGSS